MMVKDGVKSSSKYACRSAVDNALQHGVVGEGVYESESYTVEYEGRDRINGEEYSVFTVVFDCPLRTAWPDGTFRVKRSLQGIKSQGRHNWFYDR